MSKVVKVYNSNYKVAVQSGGTITLDTGVATGTTVITGNLEVRGTTTTVDSATVNIADNIIVLSDGTVGAGLPSSVGYVSGIEIDRGSLSNAKWLFDEQITWDLGGTSGNGTFYAIVDNQKLPINTPGIHAQGNLYINTADGAISVTNSSNYEESVLNYVNGFVTQLPNGKVTLDDDWIPNAKAMTDYVDYTFSNQFYSTIAQGNSRVEVIDQVHTLSNIVAVTVSGATTTIRTGGQHGFIVGDTIDISGVQSGGDPLENLNGTNRTVVEVVTATSFVVNVDTSGATASNYVVDTGTITKTNAVDTQVKITIEDINTATFFEARTEVHDLRFEGSKISSTASDADLELIAPGGGAVKINDVLEITATPSEDDLLLDPTSPLSGIKIYSKAEGPGATGLYYVNSNERNDEIVSKNRSLLFSMLF